MPPGWSSSTVPRVLARDGWTCRLGFVGVCVGHATEVHHTRPGVEDETTLVAACGPCHRVITQQQAADARWPSRRGREA